MIARPALTLASLLAGALAPLAAAAAPACNLSAYSTDTDRAGLNVRAEPSARARIVGVLPPPQDGPAADDEPPLPVEMHIVAGRDGWVEIDHAEFGDYGLGEPGVVFTGRGWVSGRLVSFDVQDPNVYAAPERVAEVIDAAAEDGEFINVRRVLSCTGEWAEVEGDITTDVSVRGRPVKGWVRDTCSNQVTTCS